MTVQLSGGLHARAHGGKPLVLSDWPVDWSDGVDAILDPDHPARLSADHVRRGRPLGTPAWTADAVERLGLASTLRDRGRPRRDGRV